MSNEPRTFACVHCGQQVYVDATLLVEVRSGDDGGTYDYCEFGPEHRHAVK